MAILSLDQKCRILNDADAADYEQRLNRAAVIFQGYVAAQQIVSGLDQAIGYTREMTLGSVKFAAVNACDAATTESINSGYRTAQDFVPLLRELFQAPSRKQ